MRSTVFARISYAECEGRTNQPAVAAFMRRCEDQLEVTVKPISAPSRPERCEFHVYTSAVDLWDAELTSTIFFYGSFVFGLRCKFIQEKRLASRLIGLGMWSDDVAARMRHLTRYELRSRFAFWCQTCGGQSKVSFSRSQLAVAWDTSFPELDSKLRLVQAQNSFGMLLQQALAQKPVPNGTFYLEGDKAGDVVSLRDEVRQFFDPIGDLISKYYCIADPQTPDKFVIAPYVKDIPSA